MYKLISNPKTIMQAIETTLAPQAIGPYSQAIMAGDFIFCSGQIPIDPKTGTIIQGGIQEQTTQVLQNLKAVLQAADAGLENVIRTEVYLADMEDFSIMNEIYSQHFASLPYPARATVEVSRLPKNVLIEIACIAQKK